MKKVNTTLESYKKKMNTIRCLAMLAIICPYLSSCNQKKDESMEICNYETSITLDSTATPLMKDLADLYNASSILNHIWCNFELWKRLDVSVEAEIRKIDCSSILNDTIRAYAQNYKENILSCLSDAQQETEWEAYSQFKTSMVERHHINRYGDLTEDEYWMLYDKKSFVSNYDSIYKLRGQSTLFLKQLMNSSGDFNEQCIYLIELAHDPSNSQAATVNMEKQMKAGVYSIYLNEMWRTWRCIVQSEYGLSKDSEIPNDLYNSLRMICAKTILNHIAHHPKDMLAINQYLILAAQDDVYRYGEFPHGNQIAIEKQLLFPERDYD